MKQNEIKKITFNNLNENFGKDDWLKTHLPSGEKTQISHEIVSELHKIYANLQPAWMQIKGGQPGQILPHQVDSFNSAMQRFQELMQFLSHSV